MTMRISRPITLPLVAAVFLAAAGLALTPFESHDLWWHLRTGDLILRQGTPPRTNLYSFTAPDTLWVTHEWLSEVLFAWLYHHAGPASLVALKMLLVGGAFALACLLGCREGGAWPAAAVALAAANASCFTFDIRPQLFTYLFLVICLGAVARHREQGGRGIYFLVPAFWLWANLHSGFILGLGLLALAAVTLTGRRGPVLGTLLLSAGAAVLTPNGWEGLRFPFVVSRTHIFTSTLTEWFSPDFHSSWLWGFEGLLLAGIVILWLSPRRPRLFDVAVLLGLLHLALQHQRHVTLFAVAAAPILAVHLSAVLRAWCGVDLRNPPGEPDAPALAGAPAAPRAPAGAGPRGF